MSGGLPPGAASTALSAVMGSRRYEMTMFEVGVWEKLINATSESAFLAFLQHHVLTSSFAPTPADATAFLGLSDTADAAYAELEQLVPRIGPYETPVIHNAVLVSAILYLGGWATVNAEMPDASESFAVKRYRERFNAAFNQALASVRGRGEVPPPLLGLSEASRNALALARATAALAIENASVKVPALFAPEADQVGGKPMPRMPGIPRSQN